jgi:UDP-glucose 4-epimerase
MAKLATSTGSHVNDALSNQATPQPGPHFDQGLDFSTVFRGVPVLITGGLGFIGSNLARVLTAIGARVHIFDCLAPEHGGSLFNIEGISASVQVTLADLRDNDGGALEAATAEAQYVFNLAGQSSHWGSMADPQFDLQMNCRAQLNLLESIRRRNPHVTIVLGSTRQIYGVPLYLPVDEDHPLQAVDVNAIHKIACESYHTLYARMHGLRCTILRLTNTIGPRMRVKDAHQTFAGLWIRRAVEGQRFEVWGGGQVRDFNYVDDVVDALLRAAASDRAQGKVYNLGASPTRLRDLAETLLDVTGCDYVVKKFPDDRKSIDIGDYYASYTRIQHDLGWAPGVTVQQALESTVAYYREHLHRYV